MIAFVVTFGRRKLQELEGRLLKLLSGLMMLALGLTLVVAPEALSRPWLAVLLLVSAAVAAWVISRIAAYLSLDGRQ